MDQVQIPPFPGARRVIVFEETNPFIRFCWVRTTTKKVKRFIEGKHVFIDGETPEILQFGIEKRDEFHMEQDNPRARDEEKWRRNFVREGRTFPNTYIHYMYCEDALDRSIFQPNAAAKEYFTETSNPVMGSVWGGPLVVSRLNRNPEMMLSMHIRDFREAVDYLIKFSRRPKRAFEFEIKVDHQDDPGPRQIRRMLLIWKIFVNEG